MSTQSLPTTHAPARRERAPSRAWHLGRRFARWFLVVVGAAVLAALWAWLVGGQSPAALWTAFNDVETPITNASGTAVGLLLGFVLLLTLIAVIRLGLRLGGGPLAMARLVFDEALRNRVVATVGGLLLITVAALPAAADLDQPLEYRIQTYLSWSVLAAGLLLGAVTVLFASWSVATDLAPGKTYEVFTKPMGRGSYLLGKWLGITLLNVCLVVSSFGVIYYGARHWLASSPALDALDRLAVDNQVLIARRAVDPRPPELSDQARDELMAAEPPGYVMDYLGTPSEAYAAQAWLIVNRAREEEPAFVQEAGGERQLFQTLITQQQSQFLAIPPDGARIYVFPGLGGIDRTSDQTLQLRYKLDESAGYDRERTLMFQLFTDRGPTRPVPIDTVTDDWQTQPISVEFITAEGELRLLIGNPLNPQRPDTLTFENPEGLRILFPVGSFEMNIVKAGAVQMARLMALAALGLAAAAAFSFPVAATASLCAWLLAAAGSYLDDALRFGGAVAETPGIGLAYYLLTSLIHAVTAVLRPFSALDYGEYLVEGVLISTRAAAVNVGLVGVATTLVLGLVGWFILSRREIARVQV